MIVGSNAFFRSIDGFVSKDTDILELIDKPIGFKIFRQIKFPNKCVFQWKRMSPQEFIDVTIKNNTPMEVGKFLVQEFNNEIGFTIDDLKQLDLLINKFLIESQTANSTQQYFKEINDTYGHEYGDILIQNAAAILRTVWDRKCIYRIGGDEFAVVYADVEKETIEKQMQMLEE